MLGVIEQSELLTLALGVAVAIAIGVEGQRLRRLRAWRVLTAAYAILLTGWTLTVLEGVLWSDTLNLVEHICYALSALMATGWVCIAFLGDRGKERAPDRSH